MPDAPRSLTLVDPKELEAIASIGLESAVQQRLDELLTLQKEGALKKTEAEQLDALLERVDRLNLVKARAQVALSNMAQP